MSEKDHYRFGLSKRGKNVNDNNTLADDLRKEVAALEGRCRKLAELLARCSGELHNYHSVAGDELLDAINDALSTQGPVSGGIRNASTLETACEHHWMPATQDGSLAIIGRGCSKCGAWETSEANRSVKP